MGFVEQGANENDMNLKNIFKQYYQQIVFTYALFNLENILLLVKPLLMGMAIDGLLSGSYQELIQYVGLYCLAMFTGISRRMYDTRTYTSIYANTASNVIIRQNGKNIGLSKVTARVNMSQKLVDFFETDVPVILTTLYTSIGALVMIYFYHSSIFTYCLLLLLPLSIINTYYGGIATVLTQKFNDRSEKGVDIIQQNNPKHIRKFFDIITRLRVRISDNEAIGFFFTELFVIGLMLLSLLAFYGQSQITAGEIVSIFQYVNMYILALDDIPYLIIQLVNLKDIQRRLQE